MNRRAFVQGAAAAAIGPLANLRVAAQGSSTRNSSFDPWIEINPENLARNVAEVSRAVGSRPIMAVVKNNGYGLGVVQVAQLLARLPQIRGLAVIKLQEAMAIREAGITAPVLLMGPVDENDLTELHARNIMPMVYTPTIGNILSRVAARAQKPIKIHVCVDTGLGRVGVPYQDAPTLIRDLATRSGIEVDGVMMTFTEDQEFDREQLRRFVALTDELHKSGVTIGLRHAASSYTFFQHPDIVLDMVRPGMALFGVYPEPAFRKTKRMNLVPAGALRTRVAYVKMLEAGESAGYNRAYLAKKDTWVATLPIGHADGWPRVAAKGAKVRINNQRYPVIASVSASHTIVEIGTEPSLSVHAGDIATLWDWVEGSRPEDVAEACGASVYDLLMHLGGHLPRRVVQKEIF